MRVGRTCTADHLIEVIETLVAERGRPDYLRCDNGPELMAWALRDWCRMNRTGITYIEPGSPWENPFIETFDGRPRRTAQHRGVGIPDRDRHHRRSLANRVLPSPLGPRRTHPRRIRPSVDRTTPTNTPMTPESTTGVPPTANR